MIESVGATTWFLPPYSPDLNPIEKMWSKVKQFLRSAKARTMDVLINAIEILFDQFQIPWYLAKNAFLEQKTRIAWATRDTQGYWKYSPIIPRILVSIYR
ncbi:MAG: transposase [Candidatus Woesebacteria bacterium]|nr:transposase [Candidatus Woesebacteria bacterium]